MFIRLGFAHKKGTDASKSEYHVSWANVDPASPRTHLSPLTLTEDTADVTVSDNHKTPITPGTPGTCVLYRPGTDKHTLYTVYYFSFLLFTSLLLALSLTIPFLIR